jgi:serine/threonine-protein kinase
MALLLAVWGVPRLAGVPVFRTWLSSVRIPTERHLAVLPLGNIGNDPANQSLCDGLMEFLTSKLTQLEQFHGTLWVVPSIEVVGQGIQSVSDAQRAFAVNLAVTGSMQRQGDMVQLNMNLVDANTLRQLTSTVISGHLGDVSLLQDRVVVELAEMLEVELKPPMLQVLTAGGTAVPRAHDLYLQGRGYLQRYEELENIETSIGLFARAVNEDSTYALAYAGLGEGYWRRYGETEEIQYVDTAIAYCAQALELDDQLAPCHVTLGLIHAGTGRYEDAEQEFERALQLDPVNADAFMGLAGAYETKGSYDQAEAIYKKAIELRPSYWAGYNHLGFFYYKRGRYEDAVTQFREVVTLTPYNLMGHTNLGGVYYLMERWVEARQAFERSLEINPNYRAYANLGTLYLMDGRYEEAAEMYTRALELDDRDYRVWGGLATTRRWMGDKSIEVSYAIQNALERAEKRRVINPNDGELLCHIAGFQQILGNPTEARELLRQALDSSPDDIEVIFHSGVTYEALGDRDKALELITKALRQGYSMAQIDRDPELRDLKEDPRFEGMIRAE